MDFLGKNIERFKDITDAVYNGAFLPDTWIQFAIIAVALMAGYGVRKWLSPKIIKSLDHIDWPYRVERALERIVALVMQVVAVVILIFASQVSLMTPPPFSSSLLILASNLLIAWVIIRALVQIINNPAMRHTISLIGWVIAALAILGVLDETSAALDDFGLNVGAFRISALTIIKGVLSLFILVYLASFIASVLERKVQKAKSISPSSKVLIGKVLRIVLITFAILIGVTSAGVDLSLLAVLSGAIGLGIGFGLQKVVSNLFSGMLLLMDKSIKPGDIIEVEGTFGWVDYMGARYTSIVTRDNKSFLIPNEDFVTQKVVNWSHGNTFVRVEVKFGVDYASDPHQIKALAEAAAKAPKRICEDPAPVCHLVGFGDSSLDFTLRFWIQDAEEGVTNVRGAVMLALWDSFKENGINIPFPRRDVTILGGSAPSNAAE
ncbi:MAG: mechanosensitive ion channel [Alphaproteobacteria bacterium]|nr:mechanosensitive ion channel [Alphaproteobacteria bacterium]